MSSIDCTWPEQVFIPPPAPWCCNNSRLEWRHFKHRWRKKILWPLKIEFKFFFKFRDIFYIPDACVSPLWAGGVWTPQHKAWGESLHTHTHQASHQGAWSFLNSGRSRGPPASLHPWAISCCTALIRLPAPNVIFPQTWHMHQVEQETSRVGGAQLPDKCHLHSAPACLWCVNSSINQHLVGSST